MAKHIGFTTYPEKVRALKLMALSSAEKVVQPLDFLPHLSFTIPSQDFHSRARRTAYIVAV